jgi:hypothetical protein
MDRLQFISWNRLVAVLLIPQAALAVLVFVKDCREIVIML